MSLAVRAVGVLGVLLLGIIGREAESGEIGEESVRCYERGARRGHDGPAAVYLRCACEGGLAIGCFELGRMFHRAPAVGRGHDQALAARRRICEGAEVDGCEAAIDTWETSKFLDVLERSCRLGRPYSCHNLSYMYGGGELVAKDEMHASELHYRAEALEKALKGESLVAKRRDPELEEAEEAVAVSSGTPGWESWRSGLHLLGADAQACVPVVWSGRYYVRVRVDGSIGTVVVRPKSEIGDCIASALERERVSPPPGGRDVWASGQAMIHK